MVTRRAIRGVLGNFLDTYTSRYTEYDGYWLFGFIVTELAELRIELLTPTSDASDAPLETAVRSAVAKFADQAQKAGLVRPQVRDAWLTIRKLPGPAKGSINGVPCAGHNVSFSAGAVMDGGRRYEREQVVFVAPHNPNVELRSARESPN
ncbi:MAG: hypothetical protein KJ000_22650 [Pirellulaceae bacterium]|nr:hypothetical protein [Pirellulaceae bacterium]